MQAQGINYGRRNPGVSRIEFDQVIAELKARIEALESEPEGEDKPRRGRKPKEATE